MSLVETTDLIFFWKTLHETNSSPLKIDPWKRRFLLETTIFRGELAVSFREETISMMHLQRKKDERKRHFPEASKLLVAL